MRRRFPILFTGLLAVPLALAQNQLSAPKTIEAGNAFSIATTGSGKATLYIAGPGQVIKRDLQLGETTSFPAGSLCNAGRYVVALAAASSSETATLNVLPASKAANLTFLAKPSRLPVSIQGGITGTAYVFDTYRNLIVTPMQVSFALSNPSSPAQMRSVETHDGAAWTAMDSTPHEGRDTFVAQVGDVSTTRVIGQVAGDPCSLKMSANRVGNKIQLQTDPIRDCSNNPVPDGTIVTFTEAFDQAKSTVDVPIKRGIAKVEMTAHPGATISVASGVVLGNQIRWEK